MKHNPIHRHQDRIIEEAADWYVRLQEPDVDPSEREAFASWILASSEHAREYLALTGLDVDIGEMPIAEDVEALIRAAQDADLSNVIRLRDTATLADEHDSASTVPTSTSIDRRGINKHWLAGIAAGIVAVTIAIGFWLRPQPDAATYVTSVGEQKSFLLSDGSVVTLNAVSRLRIQYTEQYRDIRLLSGEALFAVAKNPQRPFRVLTGDSMIQAVGTRFNVYHRNSDTRVTVVEGIVDVETRPPEPVSGEAASIAATNPARVRVTAGHRAEVAAQPGLINVSTADSAVDTAWRERRLIFESRPMNEVVSDFNLYNDVQFEIAADSLRDVRISGTFYANDPRSLAAFLQEAGLASVQVEEKRILLAPSVSP